MGLGANIDVGAEAKADPPTPNDPTTGAVEGRAEAEAEAEPWRR